MANEHAIKAYGLAPGDTFEAKFSRASIESVLFFVVAACAWTLEVLFDRHRREVTELIGELKPHTRRWYAGKAKAFQYGQELAADADCYDNTGLTDEQIAERRVVKYATASEGNGTVYIKVAGGSDGDRHALTDEQKTAFVAYMGEVKDAGVNLDVTNQEGDLFHIDIDIYYSPKIFGSSLERLDGGGNTVKKAISDFVENLPFDGEYKNASLIEALLNVEGVETVNLKGVTANGANVPVKVSPTAGYFKYSESSTINAIPYVVGD